LIGARRLAAHGGHVRRAAPCRTEQVAIWGHVPGKPGSLRVCGCDMPQKCRYCKQSAKNEYFADIRPPFRAKTSGCRAFPFPKPPILAHGAQDRRSNPCGTPVPRRI
jgi:hypothetical protein